MKNTLTIGTQYENAEGEFEVVGIKDDMVEVECISEGHINEGKRFMVPEIEAIICKYGWDYIVEFMDDEIREELHDQMSPCKEVEFLNAYDKKHLEKFGAEFELA
jgi:hypothetical protein